MEMIEKLAVQEIFSVWRWLRSWQCHVRGLTMMTCTVLSSWWILSTSVPAQGRCHQIVLGLFVRVSLLVYCLGLCTVD